MMLLLGRDCSRLRHHLNIRPVYRPHNYHCDDAHIHPVVIITALDVQGDVMQELISQIAALGIGNYSLPTSPNIIFGIILLDRHCRSFYFAYKGVLRAFRKRQAGQQPFVAANHPEQTVSIGLYPCKGLSSLRRQCCGGGEGQYIDHLRPAVGHDSCPGCLLFTARCIFTDRRNCHCIPAAAEGDIPWH